MTKEVDRESRRTAESQGRTTITVDAAIPLAIFISPESGPESGPESSAPLLSSLDGFPALRAMLGLPDRESSPEKMNDDDNNGFKCLFWIPQAWKAHLVVLGPHLPPQSLHSPPQSLCQLPPHPSLCPLPRPRASFPASRASTPCSQSLGAPSVYCPSRASGNATLAAARPSAAMNRNRLCAPIPPTLHRQRYASGHRL